MNARISLVSWWVVALCGAFGCSSDDAKKGRLLDGQPAATPDPEGERREKMQAITVIRDDGQTEEWTSGKLFAAMGNTCLAHSTPPGTGVCDAIPVDAQCTQSDCCSQQQCGIRTQICFGELMLAAAGVNPTPVIVKNPDLQNSMRTYQVLPQSASANFGIATQAYLNFARLTQRLGRLLGGFDLEIGQRDASGAVSLAMLDSTCQPSTMKRTNSYGFFASSFVDSYFHAKEAADLVVNNALAISDAELSSTPTLTLGADRASKWRAGAAALLTRTQFYPVSFVPIEFPGNFGLPGYLEPGFCNAAEPVGPVKTAVDIFRQAAVLPEDLLAMEKFQLPVPGNPGVLQPSYLVSIESLMDDVGSNTAGGSIRQRLANRWNVTIPANVGLAEYYGLTPADFAEARTYLGQEIRAFNRSRFIALPREVLPGGVEEAYDRYVATASPPPLRDSAYYSAIARAVQKRDPRIFGETNALPERDAAWGTNGPPVLSYLAFGHFANSPLADLIDDAQTWATYVMTRPAIADDPQLAEGIINSLGLIVSNQDRPGRIMQCHNYDNELDMSLTVEGFAPEDELRVVAGEDGLECATRGGVEGGPCAIENYVMTDLNMAWPPDPGFDKATTHPGFIFAPFTALEDTAPALPDRWYLIQPKRLGQANNGPGDYKVLAGFVPQYQLAPNRTPGQEKCFDIPIVPEAFEPVERLLAPSPEWCSNSGVSCAGTRFDERLPLEDELSEDNDNVETSWKHYLTLARQAADQADALGQDYLNTGTAVEQETQAAEQRAAGDIEALQEICGTAIDPSVLLAALSDTAADLGDLDGGPCDPSNPSEERTCIGGRSIKNWIRATKDPELRKLGDCIGRFNDRIPFVHLGDRALCLWREADGSVCTQEHDGFRCPDLAKANLATQQLECRVPDGTTAIMVPQGDGLGFFDTLTTLPPPPSKSLCDDIRELRHTPGATEKLQELINSNKFTATRVSFLRERLGFETRYGAYTAVTVDGEAHFETGDAGVGPNVSNWPCTTAGMATNCESGEGLFCWHGDCTTVAGRTQVNNRLLQAVLAAQFTTWTAGLPQLPLKLPVYLKRDAVPDGATRNAFFVGTFPLETQTNGFWKRFTGIDVPAEARLAHTLGRSGVGTDFLDLNPEAGTWFAIRDTEPKEKLFSGQQNVADLLRQFWAGMAQGSSEDGYLKQVLRGDSAPTNPGNGKFVTLEEGLALSCDEGFFGDDCEGDQFQEALRPYELTMPNPSAGDIWIGVGLGFGYDTSAILDGLELMCEVSEGIESRTGCSVGAPLTFRSLKDLGRMGEQLKCLGDEITQSTALAVFPDFPTAARDPLRKSSANGTYETVGGSIGVGLSELRSALMQVAASGPTIGRTIRNFGFDMQSLQETMHTFDVKNEMGDVRFQSEVANQVASCLKESTSLIGVKAITDPGNIAASAVTCANSAAQIHFADKLRDLGNEENESERQIAIADFNKRFGDSISTLQSEAIALSNALEGVSRNLSIIENARAAATRSLNKALWQLSTLNTGPVTNVLKSRKETARLRYVRAHENAKKMAFLAKRAIEQRLGMRLSELREDLPLVSAPQTWEGTVCASSGIDFEALRSGSGPNNFADSFIGDYVTKLENVVESYRLRFNFHEGTDTAVVSLRDDVLRVRAGCPVESPNLLFHASELDHYFTRFDETRPAWLIVGCESDGAQRPDCLEVERRSETPFFDAAADLKGVPSFLISFGGNWEPGTRLAQRVTLEPGRYRFSWYTTSGVEADGVVHVRKPNNDEISKILFNDPLTGFATTVGFIPGEFPFFNRLYLMFDLTETTTVDVGFENGLGFTSSYFVAAPMLERVDGKPDSSVEPRVFSDTGESRTIVLPACEDTTGEVFRSTRWDRGCVKLCPDGYSSDCGDARATTHCYRETSFHVSQQAMEAGQLFQQSGFATGNFNYRIESIGVNVVGTGVRDCSSDPLPSTCHAAGFLPYTLLHGGPFYVRNHKGEDFLAHLFSGRIEHARGLATERYFSNPIGSADRELIESYLRQEFRGRPLDGDFVLRIWEEPGLNFDAIEDVQLILNYRYWTRFD